MGVQRKGEKNSSSTKKNTWIFESVAPFLTYVFLTERFWFLVLFDFQDVFCGSFLDCLTPEWPGLRLATLFQEICFPEAPGGSITSNFKKYLKIYPPGNSHIPPWEKENHLQKCLGMGYVSSQEAI